MRIRGLLSLCLSLAAVCAPAFAARVDDGPDEFAEQVLERLDTALDEDRAEQVLEAVHDVDLVYAQVSDKLRKKLDKALAKMLASKPSAVIGEYGEPPQQRYGAAYIAAIGILHDKPGGVDILRKTLKNRHLEEWYEVRGVLYEGIALNLDGDDIALVAKGLREPDALLVSTVAGALSLYRDAEVDERREAIQELIEAWEHLTEEAEKAEKRDKGEGAREFLDQVEPAFVEAAGDLSRRRQTDLAGVRAWFAEVGRGSEW